MATEHPPGVLRVEVVLERLYRWRQTPRRMLIECGCREWYGMRVELPGVVSASPDIKVSKQYTSRLSRAVAMSCAESLLSLETSPFAI